MMKFHHALVSALAVLGASQLAISQGSPVPQPGSQVSLSVTTEAGGTVGLPCAPFQCLPHHTIVNALDTMVLDVGTAPASAYVLFFGSDPVGCQPISGIDGALAAWAPLTIVGIGVVGDAPSGYCGQATGRVKVFAPDLLSGIQVRFQALGTNDYLVEYPRLAFSQATDVMFR